MQKAVSLIMALLFYFFISCSNKKEPDTHIQVENIDKYLIDSFEVIIDKKMSLNITWVGTYAKHTDTLLVFLDYLPGDIYLYNKNTNNFVQKIHIPIEDERANLIKFINPDSIIYYTIDNKELVFCNKDSIVKKNTFLSYKPNYYFYDNTKLIDSKNNVYFQLILAYVKQANYKKEASEIPNFYSINLTTLSDRILDFTTRIKEDNKAQLIQSLIESCIDKNNDRLIYCNQMSDTIYEYSLANNILLNKHYINSMFNFTPLFFNADTCKDLDICRSALFEKSSTVSQLLYDNNHHLLYRVLHYYDSIKNKKFNILQVFNKNLHLLKELEMPNAYFGFLNLINNDLYLCKQESKNKKHVYKKFSLHSIN